MSRPSSWEGSFLAQASCCAAGDEHLDASQAAPCRRSLRISLPGRLEPLYNYQTATSWLLDPGSADSASKLLAPSPQLPTLALRPQPNATTRTAHGSRLPVRRTSEKDVVRARADLIANQGCTASPVYQAAASARRARRGSQKLPREGSDSTTSPSSPAALAGRIVALPAHLRCAVAACMAALETRTQELPDGSPMVATEEPWSDSKACSCRYNQPGPTVLCDSPELCPESPRPSCLSAAQRRALRARQCCFEGPLKGPGVRRISG